MIDALDVAALLRGAELARLHVAYTEALDALYPVGSSWGDYAARIVCGLAGRAAS